MIKTLTALNVKGRDFVHSFSKLNIISGPNFRGKTAILDAIKLAVLSFVPELGKSGKANFQLAGGESSVIYSEIKMDDGKELFRRLEMVKGSVKSTGTLPLEMPLLTPEDYFSMSDKDRREYVASRFGGGIGITVLEIISDMERHSFEEAHSEEVEEAKPTVIGWIKEIIGAKGSLSDQIGFSIDNLKQRYALFNAKAKDTAGAVRTLSELKAKEQNFDRVDDLKAQIARTENDLAAANQSYGEIIGQKKGAQTALERAEKLKKALAGEVLDFDAEIAKVTRKITDEQDTEELNSKLDGLISSKAKMDAELSEMVSERREIVTKNKDAQQNMSELEHLKACPFCKSKGKGWDQTLRDHYQGIITKAQADQKIIESGMMTLSPAIEDTQKEINSVKMEIEKAILANSNRIAALKEREALKGNQRTILAARKDWQEQLDAITETELPDEELIETAKILVDEQRDCLNALKERLSAALGIQNDIKRAAESAEANKQHTAMLTVIKAYGKKLTEIQSKAVGGVFVEMLEIANKIAEGILLSPIAYHEGEIGRWDNGRFISHLTFSGTEKTITYSAIAAALSSKSPYKIMLIDELSRLTPTMVTCLLDKLTEAVEEGIIDQVILVEPRDNDGGEIAPWNHIHVS